MSSSRSARLYDSQSCDVCGKSFDAWRGITGPTAPGTLTAIYVRSATRGLTLQPSSHESSTDHSRGQQISRITTGDIRGMRSAFLAKKAKVSKKTSLLSKLAEKAFTLHGETTAVVQSTYRAAVWGPSQMQHRDTGDTTFGDSSTSEETLPHISLGDALLQIHGLDEMVMETDPLSLDVLQNPLWSATVVHRSTWVMASRVESVAGR